MQKGMHMERVMVGPAILAGGGPYHEELTRAGLEPIFPKRNAQMTEAEVIDQLRGLRFVVAGSEPYNRRVLDALPDLKVIARAGVGYDAVDVAACTERGIVVGFAPNTNNEAVAEHALMLMLVLAKKLYDQHNQLHEGKWPRKAYESLRGKTVGIVGLGRVGKQVATRALAFKTTVIACDPYIDGTFAAAHGFTMVGMEELLARSDFVTLHTPSTPETEGMVNQAFIERMKKTAYLLNTARGTIVHESDLVVALKNRTIAGAGLDVFADEPLAADHPFLQLDNVILSAHTAGVDEQSVIDMGHVAAKVVVAIRAGQWPEEWIVNNEIRTKFQL
jgi:D-3-phosphoglycerate dehydrogenase / 2-oxoglutarate reductase